MFRLLASYLLIPALDFHYIFCCDIFLMNWRHIHLNLDSQSNFSIAEANKNLQIFRNRIIVSSSLTL